MEEWLRDELKRIWKEVTMVCFKYYSTIALEYQGKWREPTGVEEMALTKV
jgi:hypothetical protein